MRETEARMRPGSPVPDIKSAPQSEKETTRAYAAPAAIPENAVPRARAAAPLASMPAVLANCDATLAADKDPVHPTVA